MSLVYALNTTWMWKCQGQLRAFHRATNDVARIQEAVLAKIVVRNKTTTFGMAHGFKGIETPREFQNRVPLSNYDTYAAPIDRIAAGERNVLTQETVRLLEPTSGTSGGEKLIPYTSSLARQFQLAVAAWIGDLMQYRPAVRRGRAYWSISPALGQTRITSGGIPIGFADDTAYLGSFERFFIRRLLAVPPEITQITNIENFRYITLLRLIQANDLALISIWSPTFLSALLGSFEEWADRLCYDLRNGSLNPPNGKDINAGEQSIPSTQSDVLRANTLESICRGKEPLAEKLRRIWPNLALISCWTDAAAAGYVDQVKSLFPTIEIQSKGLLATEGIVSFPLIGRPGAALAVRSHFFEFAKVDVERGTHEPLVDCLLSHELSIGSRYRIILTTAGGLYRYQLDDVIEVVAFERECPLLRFVGKAHHTSDLVGEKLSAQHVEGVLNRMFFACGIKPNFSLVVPITEKIPHYRLYLQGNCFSDSQSLRSTLAHSIQTGLEENPYYRHAIEFRQLLPLDVCLLNSYGKPGWVIYEQGCISRGQKVGNIKPTALDGRTGWADEFSQYVIRTKTQKHSHSSP